ncbi:diguanylate cyclase [Planosporangium sp. 12N6]|uniref:diguanylate cyclase n=1 Tax=Planosporangium spinosum TaxID=3402278 RepID=UPI003CFBA984
MPARLGDGPGADPSYRVRAIRTGGLRGALGPGIAALYVLATWNGPHRPVMLAIAATMLAAALLARWQAPAIARSRARLPVQLAGIMVNILGSTALSLLDGGVTSPLGPMVPFSLIFFAVMVPPRVYGLVFVASTAAYWVVALLGDPAPAGYPWVYTLAFAGVGYLCVRHAGTLASLRRRLTEAARLDPLTGCLNRRGFDQRLGSALADAARTGAPVTLVLADLDRFKEVNDTYGHRAGDDVLAWTGQTMRRHLREHDAVGRLGGDEFAAVLDGTDATDAEVLVARLRAALDPVAPASIGYVSYPAEAATAHDLLRLADARLYRDKSGRAAPAPVPDAVATARLVVDRRAAAAVSQRERRRRSIADMGWVAVSDFAIGLLYAAFFAVQAPHRMAMAALSACGCAAGLLVVAAAGRLSRSAAARWFMVAFAVASFPVGIAVAVLDGGAGSATALGILVPMPLIALGTPPRVAVPILVGLSACYLTLAALVGAPSGWYVTTHLAGIVAVSVICAVQGTSAARQRRLLTRLSRVDPLTDCLNRRGFAERFTGELASARRTGRVMSLLILDLDGFKKLNDACGHAAGDDLLRWVARTLRRHLHPADVVARLGGDEFVVLLAGATAPAARTAADRLRTVLAERTPVSVGTATLGAHGHDFDALYAHADGELYTRKPDRRYSRRSDPVA